MISYAYARPKKRIDTSSTINRDDERKQERVEMERMRAEYFAKGGIITHYPRGYQGPPLHTLREQWQQKRAEARAKADAKRDAK